MIRLVTKERQWTLLFILPFYFGYGQWLFSFLFMMLGSLFQWDLNSANIDALFNLVYLALLGVVLVYIYRDYLKKSYEKMKGRWLKEITYACTLGSLKFYVINIICSMMIMLIHPGGVSANQEAVSQLALLEPTMMIVSTVILAPLVEELIFRVGLFQLFYTKSRTTAYLVSSLAFGFVHIVNGLFAGDFSQILYLLPYGLLGAVLCRFYEKRDTIFAPMMIHALNNLIGILIIL